MSLTSLDYFLFLPIIFLLYHLSKGRIRWVGLLLASYVFYARAGAWYLLIALGLVTVLSYSCGLLLVSSVEETLRRSLLICGIAGNVAVLIGMKCLPFLVESIGLLASQLAVHGSLPKPTPLVSVGISYLVFQAVGYLVNVYLEVEEPERHAGYDLLNSIQAKI